MMEKHITFTNETKSEREAKILGALALKTFDFKLDLKKYANVIIVFESTRETREEVGMTFTEYGSKNERLYIHVVEYEWVSPEDDDEYEIGYVHNLSEMSHEALEDAYDDYLNALSGI